MAKNKERSETEYLKSENRQLWKENKMLRRQVARLSKRTQDVEELEEALKEEQITQEHNYVDPTQCKECLKGKISITSLGIRTIKTCNGCTYREITKC